MQSKLMKYLKYRAWKARKTGACLAPINQRNKSLLNQSTRQIHGTTGTA